MANIFLFANKHIPSFWFVAVCTLLATLFSTNVNAVPRTPSQALPEMFQKPPGLDFYNYKKNKAKEKKTEEILN